MKKYFLILSSLFVLASTSCSQSELELNPPYADGFEAINTEERLQSFLNGAYLNVSSAGAYGTQIMVIGDVLADKLYVSNTNSSYLLTYNHTYNGSQNEFGFYGTMYDAIMKCNIVINNAKVASSANVNRIKAEAKILRALCYFTLVSYYSPTPTSGANQEYGVPLVLSDYDVSIQPKRASVTEVYNQIISDLEGGIANAEANPAEKVQLSKTAAKLILTKVYLTRRASGDAEKALQYSTDILNGGGVFAPIAKENYNAYFAGNSEATSENQPETIWELDMNTVNNNITGVGSNVALPVYYDRREASRRCLLFTKGFYDSFPTADVRKGSAAAGLLTTTAVPNTDTPTGAWTNKYLKYTQSGNYTRNIKVFRFADAQLSQIEALHLTGQSALALTKLNAFASSRGGYTYTGTNLLDDILNERAKEFYGEGQRFLDLKRYNLPIVKSTNCAANCNIPANDKLFVLPISQGAIDANPNLKQYPGY